MLAATGVAGETGTAESCSLGPSRLAPFDGANGQTGAFAAGIDGRADLMFRGQQVPEYGAAGPTVGFERSSDDGVWLVGYGHVSRFRQRVLLVLGSTLLTLLVVEVVFRATLPSYTYDDMYVESSDAFLGVTLRPDSTFEFDGLDILIPATQVSISAQGLRDREYEIPKPYGTKRVLCMGDSMTFGWGVEERDCWCRILAGRLTTGGAGWEVINMGVPGYNFAQSVHYLGTKGVGFQPDLTVFLFNRSDYLPAIEHGASTDFVSWMVAHVALYRWIHMRTSGAERDLEEGVVTDSAAVQPAAEKLARLGREHGFRSAVFMLESPTAEDEAFMGTLEGLGIAAEVLQLSVQGEEVELTIPDDGHPNTEAHHRIGAFIENALRERGLSDWGGDGPDDHHGDGPTGDRPAGPAGGPR